MSSAVIRKIEDFVRREAGGLVAHDFKHVDRVRNLALMIAASERFAALETVEAAALLHDIGLARAKDRRLHGEVGAAVAHAFLTEHRMFPPQTVDEIAAAIKFHNTGGPGRDGLSAIIRDADTLDLLGAVGIMRAFVSKSSLPDYDPAIIKGKTWKKKAVYFDKSLDEGLGTGGSIVDQINFQISRLDKLTTRTARKFGRRLVRFMKIFLGQLEAEIGQQGRH